MASSIATINHHHSHQVEIFSNTVFGFWIYLMSDCLIFTTLFATYAVLYSSTFGGPSSQEIYHLSTAFAETLILLTSSLTCGLGMLHARHGSTRKLIGWLCLTFLLGLSFIVLELKEFSHLIYEGNSWQKSAFLSSFFSLVGTHGLHVSFGLLWMIVMIGQLFYYGLTVSTFRRLVCLNLFWHFLDLIWIFIFTFVYLMGIA